MSEWHVPDEVLSKFSSNPGEFDDVTAASLEQHLTACSPCQASIAAIPQRTDLDAIWAAVEDQVDGAGGGFTERVLRRLGVDSGAARLIAATPALSIGALAAVGLIVAAVVFAGRANGGGAAFLVLAPLVPTALVALSFSPGADPAGECGLATPVYGFALLMRRAVGIEIVALVLLAMGSMFVPIDGPRALGWLLPALALSLGTLAGGVRWTAPQTAGVLTAAWLTAVALANFAQSNSDLAESNLFGPAGQLSLAVIAAGACAVVAANRQAIFQEVQR